MPASKVKMVDVPARGAPVVEAILAATFEELARVGYGGLRLEEVAERAGVNKTTVYRRFPTKVDLVTAAIVSFTEQLPVMPDTGTLRGDLTFMAREFVRLAGTTPGRALIRFHLLEGRLPELAQVEERFRRQQGATGLVPLLHRAVARGHLPRGTDATFIEEALLGTLYYASLVAEHPLDDAFAKKLVEAVVSTAGVSESKSRARKRARKGSPLEAVTKRFSKSRPAKRPGERQR